MRGRYSGRTTYLSGRIIRRLLATAFLLGAALPLSAAVADEPTPDVAPDVTMVETPSWVQFTNRNGAWTIFTRCLGPRAHRRFPVTVGPGYIARAQRLVDGVVVTNDERRAGPGNAPGNGGLGGFGWHGARRGGSTFDYNHAWSIDGRTCAADGWALGRPFRPGVGVHAWRVTEAPNVVAGVGHLSVDVWLADVYGPLVRLRYRYEVHPEVVRMQLWVTEIARGGHAYVKEPKALAAAGGGGYTRMVVLDGRERIARNDLSENRDGDWQSRDCIWMGVNAYEHTGQCDADARERVRFDFGDYASGADGRCADRCLKVAMHAMSVGGRTALWEGSGLGLDGWAMASGRRPAYALRDSRLDGVRWSCKAGSSSAPIVRRWELVGYAKNAAGEYAPATAMFHGWEGGRGFGDCEPQSRRFGPRGEIWAVEAEFSFGD